MPFPTPFPTPSPTPSHHRPLLVAVLCFPDVEALDLAGPVEVFTTASRMAQRAGAPEPFTVVTVAPGRGPVQARAGLTVLPDHDFGDPIRPDVLVVPGGVVDAALADDRTLAWIASADRTAVITASVCTGAFLLAAAGVLTGGPVTTHWEDQDDLAARYPGLEVRSGVRWVDQGRVVTSGGISAGIDMSLHLVDQLAGRELAERTARQLEFDWREAPSAG
ncbi:DJ-1/PfpI family protein [Nakamurella leprariae]|uniref:DJ-1/PfpI family protein n=1 Tax=Nakamurella leprariae TaxID=2803911 RepID=UPI0038B2409B